MGARRKGRERALQILFQLDFNTDDVRSALSEFWNTHPTYAKAREFAERIVIGALENREKIDAMIDSTLENWSLNRLASVDKAILRCATYELMHMPDVPPKVTINEAVEIAKAYGTDDSGRFINGVLDKIREKIGKSIEITGLAETGEGAPS